MQGSQALRASPGIGRSTFGLSASFAKRVFHKVKNIGWSPCRQASSNSQHQQAGLQSEPRSIPHARLERCVALDDNDAALRNLVRLALANAVEEGRSWQSFVRDVARHRLADAKAGSQYATRDFATQVTAAGAMVMAQMDARDFADDLPGLGIPSDFAVYYWQTQ